MTDWKTEPGIMGVVEPIHGPAVPLEMLRERQQRIAAEATRREEQDTHDWLAGLRAKAEAEAEAWAALPCRGVADFVSSCSGEFAAKCDRRLHVMCARSQVQRAIQEQHAARYQLRQRLSNSGVPDRVLVAAFDHEPLETEAIKALRAELAKTPKPTLILLSGGVGCGKSCAAAWWLGRHGGDWVSAGDLAKISPYAEGGGMERLRAPRLVLDDLGMEYLDAKGFMQATLDGVIDHRYANMLPTVITTNLSAAEFKQRYGPRITDRIREAGTFIVIVAPSLRRKS